MDDKEVRSLRRPAKPKPKRFRYVRFGDKIQDLKFEIERRLTVEKKKRPALELGP